MTSRNRVALAAFSAVAMLAGASAFAQGSSNDVTPGTDGTGGTGGPGGTGVVSGLPGGDPNVPVRVLLEVAGVAGPNAIGDLLALPLASFDLDQNYGTVPIVENDAPKPTPIGTPIPLAPSPPTGPVHTFIVRGEMLPGDLQHLKSLPEIVDVWTDALVGHTGPTSPPVPGRAPLAPPPTHPCELFPVTVPPTLAEVRAVLGASSSMRFGGEGVVIGVVDGGIDAPVLGAELAAQLGITTDPVIGGYPNDWGTTGAAWAHHGSMSAFDALTLAPKAKIYDLRISDNGSPFLNPNRALISDAIAAYSWAIGEYANTGKPQILTNSWGIFDPDKAPDYAVNLRHPFTRKVEEALDAGMIVLFAAGNCGDDPTFPFASTCGGYIGHGRSIWGANGHERVLTVGAATADSELLCFSSRGPAALAGIKPDFLSASHFLGFYSGLSGTHFADSGTSAACATAAGFCALLLEAVPNATQAELQRALGRSAHDIWSATPVPFPRPDSTPPVLVDWNPDSGAGILRLADAYWNLMNQVHGATDPSVSMKQ